MDSELGSAEAAVKKVAELKLSEGEPQGQMKVTTAKRKVRCPGRSSPSSLYTLLRFK